MGTLKESISTILDVASRNYYRLPENRIIVDILEEVENEQEIQSDRERLLRLHTRRQITI